MRAIVVLTFLVVVVALAFSIMAFTRVNTTLSVANEASDKTAKVEKAQAAQEAEVQRLVQVEVGGVRAGLEARVADLSAEVKKVADSAPNEAAIKAQVRDALNQVGKQFMEIDKSVRGLQGDAGQKDAKIAELEKKIEAAQASIVQLTRLVRGFMSIIAPPEKPEPVQPEAQPEAPAVVE